MRRACSSLYSTSLLLVASVTVTMIAMTGCGKPSGTDFDSELILTKSCQAAPDQRGTFMAKVPGFPLHLVADADFTPVQQQGIQHAVSQWNQLGHRLMGQDFYDLRFASLDSSYHSTDPRDCSRGGFGSADTFSIVREKSLHRWSSLGFSKVIPGATLRCWSGTLVDHQVIMIYDSVVDSSQFSSVVIHELGHSLGLDHSCVEAKGSTKFRSCVGLSEDDPYREAVMYPSLRARASLSDQPEIKDLLRPNDSMRASCLYDSRG